MKIGIIGSRSFDDYEQLCIFINSRVKLEDITLVVSGGATGADSLGERFAAEHNIEVNIFLPEWSKYGKKAGIIRNKDIVEGSDVVFAFWDGVSPGTKNSIKRCETIKKDIHVYIIGSNNYFKPFRGIDI